MQDEDFHEQDNEMDRFERARVNRFNAQHAVIAVLVGAIILALAAGGSIQKQGNEMKSSVGRSLVQIVGNPASRVASALPLQSAAHSATHWIKPNPTINGPGGFTAATDAGNSTAGIPPVTPDAFDPRSLGVPAAAPRPLHTVLVTGDSMSEPLDQDIAQALAPDHVNVVQDPHVGTGISSTLIVNWGQLAAYQVRHYRPQAVVVFIGANDGFSMPGPGGKSVQCCGVEWTAAYSQRVREMMSTYRQDGVARVYWLTLPLPRDSAHAVIARAVNAAIEVAAEPWRAQIHVINTVSVFTPGAKYRDSMLVGGQPTIVRQSDGVHLNDAGSQVAANLVMASMRKDWRW